MPGFGVEESGELDEMTSDPSHLGAPGMNADPAALTVGPDGVPGAEGPTGQQGEGSAAAPAPMTEEPETSFDTIDPTLLDQEKPGTPVEWIFIAIAVVVLLVGGVLLALFL